MQLTILDSILIGDHFFPYNLFLQGLLTTNKQMWYLDSGCSKYMTDQTLRDEGFVIYGDNNKGKILDRGDVVARIQ